MPRRSKASIDAESVIIRAQVESLRRREVEFQKLIDEMQNLKVSISAERLALEGKRRALELERSPINWLPPELLAHIFLQLITVSELPKGIEDCSAYAEGLHPAITISHVCQSWRNIALATPQIWSCLFYRGASWDERSRPILIKRSDHSPLDIIYWGSLDVLEFEEEQRILRLFYDLSAHFQRIRSITLECHGTQAIKSIMGILSDLHHKFLHLTSLNLSILNHNPSFSSTLSLLGNSTLEPTDVEFAGPGTLRRLKLREIPLLKFPSRFLINLTTLILTYPPKRAAGRDNYRFLLTSLCHFLKFTPRLEILNLYHAVPAFHGSEDDPDPRVFILSPVDLGYLKSLHWSFPDANDIRYVLACLHTPALEKLDLWVEDDPSIQINRDSYHHLASIGGSLKLPIIQQLSLQCASSEGLTSAVRKFEFSVLENLEITNTGDNGKGNTPLPELPGLEYVFWDPRMPHLTHFTLSNFGISPDPGKAEALLGYMPVLVSLSLDACTRVGKLLKGLQEKAIDVHRIASGGVRSRRGVKYCPRLEAISLWSCKDVNIDDIRAVLMARNTSPDTLEEGNSNASQLTVGFRGARREENGKRKAEEGMMGRKIRPLRKGRRQGHAVESQASSALLNPSMNVLSSIIAMEEAFQPANIVYLRIEDCPSINRENTSTLEGLGIADLVFNDHTLSQ